MRTRIYQALALVVLGLVFIYCEKKPEKELQDAQNAVKELEELGAPQYIPDEWQALKTKLDDALAKIERRKYREAKEILTSIIADAPTLKQKIEEKKAAEKPKEEEQQAPEAATPPAGTQPPTQ